MILDSLKLSLLVSTTAIIFITLIGVFFGYLFARKRFTGKNALESLLTLPMILPPTVTGYYIILLFGRNGIFGGPIFDLTGFSFVFTWQGAALASIIVALPIMIKSSTAAFENVDPEFEMISYSLGKNELTTFIKIALPLAKKGIVAGIILSFARAIGEFGATLMISGNIQGKTQTMPLAIYEAFLTGQDRLAFFLVSTLTLFSLLIIYFTNRLSKTA